VHLDLRCVDLAEKRRAFPRALRLVGPLDVTPVRDHVVGALAQQVDQQDPSAVTADAHSDRPERISSMSLR
jgi:hypothetical protein